MVQAMAEKVADAMCRLSFMWTFHRRSAAGVHSHGGAPPEVPLRGGGAAAPERWRGLCSTDGGPARRPHGIKYIGGLGGSGQSQPKWLQKFWHFKAFDDCKKKL
jgi:hypothetical protein